MAKTPIQRFFFNLRNLKQVKCWSQKSQIYNFLILYRFDEIYELTGNQSLFIKYSNQNHLMKIVLQTTQMLLFI